MKVDINRTRALNNISPRTGTVIYWCSRDQRSCDNWALLYACKMAKSTKSPLCVAFCLIDNFPGANTRHYDFMLDGLAELQSDLRKKNIPFYLLTGTPEFEVPRLAENLGAGCVVCDFSPLKIKLRWDSKIAAKLKCSLIEVDAHNIVPARIVSDKQEYAARTIRPKINSMLGEFLTEPPKLQKYPHNDPLDFNDTDWSKIKEKLYTTLDKLPPVNSLKPGTKAANKLLKSFINYSLACYDTNRNDPNLNGQSGLSPYLHFGHISAQRIATEVQKSDCSEEAKKVFLEELIIRRELADNFCLHNKDYDNFNGLPKWAQLTLKAHEKDPRPYIYDFDALEKAQTNDEAWNAAQLQMVHTGKMHGYMRMYWAKKILEWTPNAKTAINWAIKLNDSYELDGRDPNGFTGVLWAIGGLHDRPWATRSIFGNVRYMNLQGLRRKFDVDRYISTINKLI